MYNTILEYAMRAVVVLIALSFHEFAHGFVSDKLGDPTPRSLGRLTLNPLKHLDPIGAFCMLVARIGWAKPVPVNARYYKNPRVGMALTAAAGPLMNLILGFVGSFFYVFMFFLAAMTNVDGMALRLLLATATFFSVFMQLNVALAIFNLIPIPPFDGSRILFIFLPPKLYFGIMRYERYIQIGVLVLCLLGSFSGFIGFLTSGICNGFVDLWSLVFGF